MAGASHTFTLLSQPAGEVIIFTPILLMTKPKVSKDLLIFTRLHSE